MKGNRRNFYRLLHVQPEAPTEIVTACYRTMMSKLRLHPDLGGDHEAAALINQAYAVLSDPGRRKQYDRGLLQQRGPVHRHAVETVLADAAPAPSMAQRHCIFCQAGVPAQIRADSRCRRCDTPLLPPPDRPSGKHELFGRRQAPRVAKTDVVSIYPGWQLPARIGRLHDLSLAGIGVVTDVSIQANQVVRIVGPAFDVLARVISCRSAVRQYKVHARLLTAIFARSTGTFVSMKA